MLQRSYPDINSPVKEVDSPEFGGSSRCAGTRRETETPSQPVVAFDVTLLLTLRNLKKLKNRKSLTHIPPPRPNSL